MSDIFTFDQEAARNIIKAAKQVLSGGDAGGGTVAYPTTGLQCITVKLLSKTSGEPSYTWQQERRTSSGWETFASALDDSDGTYLAYDLDESSTSDMTNTHVFLARTVIKNEESDKLQPGWLIVWGYEELRGLYQGQVRTMLSDRVPGWDYLKLHSV